MSVKDADGHKLLYHPEEIARWKREGEVAPLHVEIGITNRCNHRCSFCSLGWITNGVDDIDDKVMLRAIEDFGEMGVKSVYFAGEGEPTIHKGFSSFVKKSADVGLKIALSTNGSKFNGEMSEDILGSFSWIRFSLDACRPETYKVLHGVSERELKRVIKNIKDAVRVKKENGYEVDIGVQAIFEPRNADEIVEMGKMMKEIGVDNFQVKPAHNHPNSKYSPDAYDFNKEALIRDLKELETDDFTVVVRLKSLERISSERTWKRCHAFDVYGLIDARGNVAPCNVYYQTEGFQFGNLYEQSFRDIWFGEKKKEVIGKIENECFARCGVYRCRQDVMNRYLERVKNPERNDEFI